MYNYGLWFSIKLYCLSCKSCPKKDFATQNHYYHSFWQNV